MLVLLLLSACESSISQVIPLDETPAGDLVVNGEADFGDIGLGENAAVTLALSNVGEGPLAITGVTLDAEGVTMTQPTLGGLAAGSSVPLVLTYAPTEPGCVSGNLLVTSDDPEEPVVSVPVLGCAVDELRNVSLTMNFDDKWEAWLDGEAFTASNSQTWQYADVLSWELEPGPHLLAIKATNTGGAGALIGAITVDGEPVTVTGDGAWLVMDREPGDTWTTDAYDDSRWEAGVPCASENYGVDQTGDARELGAAWISVNSECRNFSEAWFRVEFTVE